MFIYIYWCSDQKYLGNSEMWWRKMEKNGWTDHYWNEEVLHRVKEESNILHTIKRRKTDWIGHILCRNYLLKHVIGGNIERKIEVTGRREKRCKQLLDDLKGKRGYWKWKDEELDCCVWGTCFGRSYRPVIRQTTEWMNCGWDNSYYSNYHYHTTIIFSMWHRVLNIYRSQTTCCYHCCFS